MVNIKNFGLLLLCSHTLRSLYRMIHTFVSYFSHILLFTGTRKNAKKYASYLFIVRKFYNLMKSICFWSQASLCQFMFKELCSLLERNIQGFFTYI